MKLPPPVPSATPRAGAQAQRRRERLRASLLAFGARRVAERASAPVGFAWRAKSTGGMVNENRALEIKIDLIIEVTTVPTRNRQARSAEMMRDQIARTAVQFPRGCAGHAAPAAWFRDALRGLLPRAH